MAARREPKEFELLWRGAKSYGSSADILAGNFASGGPSPAQCCLAQSAYCFPPPTSYTFVLGHAPASRKVADDCTVLELGIGA